MLTRDDLLKEARMRRGNFPTLIVVYLVLLGTMIGSAAAIL
ncbi:MAG: hypothetical protein AAGE18_05235 [Pseudomonadota bacterium]